MSSSISTTLAQLLVRVLASFIAIATQAQAEAPKVVADIAPVHSLVSMVLGDKGSAELLIAGAQSPHDFSLRPSVAKSLAAADIIIRVGSELTPWLDGPLKKLAHDADVLTLLDVATVTLLPARENAYFAAHKHGEHEEHEEDTLTDPHAWLDPNNAMLWLDAIVIALSRSDSANAIVYQQNAALAKAQIHTVTEQLKTTLAPYEDKPMVVYHDSFQYFERFFNINAVGSIAASDAARPGPARVAQVRRLIKEQNVGCVLGEPQFNSSLVESIAPSVKLATVDILGASLKPGAELYNNMLLSIGEAVETCLQ